jgi:hypothetical protein
MAHKAELKVNITYQPRLECDGCSWTYQGRDAVNQAKHHVKVWGHEVFVLWERRAKYGPEPS